MKKLQQNEFMLPSSAVDTFKDVAALKLHVFRYNTLQSVRHTVHNISVILSILPHTSIMLPGCGPHLPPSNHTNWPLTLDSSDDHSLGQRCYNTRQNIQTTHWQQTKYEARTKTTKQV